MPEEEKLEASAEEMLSKLRCMFGIPVIVIGSEDDDIPDSIMRGDTNKHANNEKESSEEDISLYSQIVYAKLSS